MSQSDDSPAPAVQYAPENWWYDQLGEHPGYQDDDADPDRDYGQAHSFLPGKTYEEYVAHDILRRTGRLLCATTLLDPPDLPGGRMRQLFAWLFEDEHLEHDPTAMHHANAEVELSDPEVRVAKSAPGEWGFTDYRQSRHRKRVADESGYISGGESTGVLIADRPLPAFMDIVDVVLALSNLPPKQQTEVRQFARSAKQAGDEKDVDILAKVLAMAKPTDHHSNRPRTADSSN